jgi:archaellum component FlaC
LRETVSVLRSELERVTREHGEAMQQLATAHRSEVLQLHETIRALRDVLEARQA